MNNMRDTGLAPADAASGNWVDRLAPAATRPYLRLARFDRPIGTWLLLFPCWWSLMLGILAAGGLGRETIWPTLAAMALFYVGATVMRGAGCTYNDIVDRDFDGRVERTRNRPIPSGQVSVAQARIFMVALALVGLVVLLQFNRFTVGLAISSLVLVAIYPFMKRRTYWPQLVLGFTFNWGALVGWASVHGGLEPPPIVLYIGSVLWTVGYDTIYAHQDKEDDLALGLKSTAIRFGTATRPCVAAFYAGALILWAAAAFLAGAGLPTFGALGLVALHAVWQIATLDIADPDNCLTRFRSNRDVGWIILAGFSADAVLRAA
jgi:4-hydroxybenzoate polyprenyltransferase